MKVSSLSCVLTLSLVGAISGCMVYPDRTAEIKNDLVAGRPTAYDVYSRTGGNRLLALQESGRLAQWQGKYRESADLYGEAIAFSDKLEDKALFSIGDAADSTMSVASGNDLTMDYPVLPFERMMLHVMSSCNCLALGDVDGFGVDMRHLERIHELSKKAIADGAKEANVVETGYEEARQSVNMRSKGLVASPSDFAPVAKSSCDNAYALYLMALYREMNGDVREALSYYELIREFGIKNPSVDKGISACKNESKAADEGEIIAILEEGFVPGKREDHAVVDMGSSVPNLNMTLPSYSLADCLPYQEGGPLVLFEDKKCLSVTTPLCDIAALAVKAHDERLKGIVRRKALTSGVATGLIGLNTIVNGTICTNPFAEALLLIGGLFTCPVAEIAYLCSERPDLRSWTLLPRRVQLSRISLKSGRHELLLYAAGEKQKLVVDVKPGVKTIVHCMALPGSIKCFSANLEK